MRTVVFFLLVLLTGCASVRDTLDRASDAPEPGYTRSVPTPQPATYEQALAAWGHAEDVNAWIGANFRYDVDRAVALSERQRAAGPSVSILEPHAFYANPAGMCVDLARFAVETLRHVSPGANARYLMIEFDPASIRGQVLRRHWVAVYESSDGIRVVADSKRPGLISGPYRTVDEFVSEYAQYRQRRIVSYRELDSYQRESRMRRAEPALSRVSADASR